MCACPSFLLIKLHGMIHTVCIKIRYFSWFVTALICCIKCILHAVRLCAMRIMVIHFPASSDELRFLYITSYMYIYTHIYHITYVFICDEDQYLMLSMLTWIHAIELFDAYDDACRCMDNVNICVLYEMIVRATSCTVCMHCMYALYEMMVCATSCTEKHLLELCDLCDKVLGWYLLMLCLISKCNACSHCRMRYHARTHACPAAVNSWGTDLVAHSYTGNEQHTGTYNIQEHTGTYNIQEHTTYRQWTTAALHTLFSMLTMSYIQEMNNIQEHTTYRNIQEHTTYRIIQHTGNEQQQLCIPCFPCSPCRTYRKWTTYRNIQHRNIQHTGNEQQQLCIPCSPCWPCRTASLRPAAHQPAWGSRVSGQCGVSWVSHHMVHLIGWSVWSLMGITPYGPFYRGGSVESDGAHTIWSI